MRSGLHTSLIACRDLIARIMRDGGHHEGRVGLTQAAYDAEERVLALQELEGAVRELLAGEGGVKALTVSWLFVRSAIGRLDRCDGAEE